ncbi:hypothetical protein [Polyangium sp. y55x31]|uniref:hypothetical protein n=1 Tax=Polyangium sp. y55x31 TaxID=3042688 RepID=UPI0024832442|nr:hypothetical protein [Polyangium sp. y55x31]MDI1476386.1 hypothetical protein [Polyangium sp. y55x31]
MTQRKRKASTHGVVIPDRKISETILDFGEPLLSQLGPAPPIEVAENALRIVITVWNAHVMAMSVWGIPEHLAHVQDLLRDPIAPQGMKDAFAALSVRRREKFSEDPRAVGEWSIVPDGHGGHQFRCDARVPPSLLPEP